MDYRQLFKLRLVVAAMGETQRLGWWNSGVLTGTGEFLFQQGFPRSMPFAQTRAGFRVAQLACDEALAIQPTPGGPISINQGHIERLAAGFLCGTPGQLVVPYLQVAVALTTRVAQVCRRCSSLCSASVARRPSLS